MSVAAPARRRGATDMGSMHCHAQIRRPTSHWISTENGRMVVDAAMRPVSSLAHYVQFLPTIGNFSSASRMKNLRNQVESAVWPTSCPGIILQLSCTILQLFCAILQQFWLLPPPQPPVCAPKSSPLWLFLTLSRTIPPSSLVK